MVESTLEGDGIARPITYAIWRDDKPAQEGYSRELISIDTPREFWDNYEGMPKFEDECFTILDYFERSVKLFPDGQFLGTRTQLENDAAGKPQFGEYTWKTWRETEVQVQCLARGIEAEGLTTQT
jgi:hypothetical protein